MTAPTTAPRTAPSEPAPPPHPDEHHTHDVLRAHLAEHFATRAPRAAQYGPHFARLWQLVAEHAQGGKLVRPALFLRAHRVMARATGRSWATEEQLLPLATALELLHFAFLLHDDVIDGDTLRRGRPNLIGTLRADHTTQPHPPQPPELAAHTSLHWGQTGAILAGNLLLSHAHQMFARTPGPAEVRSRALDLLDHTITESVAGEHTDVALSDHVIAPDLETILTTAAHKTATYTFALPLHLAATLAGAPLDWQAPLDDAARHLGLAFQLQDDYLSTFGDAARHGKDPFADLREGKQNAIIAFAQLTSAWPLVHQHIGDGTLDEADAAAVVTALRDCGADRFVHGLVLEHRDALTDTLTRSTLPTEVQRLLQDLDADLAGRQS